LFLFPNGLVNAPSLARDPSFLASLPSNSKMLALLSQHRSSQVTMCSPGWWLKSFRMSRSSTRDRDRLMISVSISRDDPCSLSSLLERSALFASFFSFTGATATGTGWLLCSVTVPVAGAGAAATAVPAGGARTTRVAAAAVVPVGGAVPAAVPTSSFPSPFPFRALNQVEQGSVGMGQTPARCGDLCLSGVLSVAAHFLQIFY